MGHIEGISTRNFILEKFHLHFCYSCNFQREEGGLKSWHNPFWGLFRPKHLSPLGAEYS